MIQDTDEQVVERGIYTIKQERQVDRTVAELMAAYRMNREGKLRNSVVSARYSLRLFSENSIDYNMSTDFEFQVDLNAVVHQPGSIWDLTKESTTRACVEHYLRGEIDATYKKYGKRGYLYFKYAF